MGDRFILVAPNDERIPEDARVEGAYYSVMLDTRDGRLVAEDGGEPEDQTFGRDWSWVPDELNALAARIDDLTEQLRRVIAGCEVALVEPHRARRIVEDMHDDCVRVYNGEAPKPEGGPDAD